MNDQNTAFRQQRTGWLVLRITLTVEVTAGVVPLWNVLQGFFAAGSDPMGQRVSLLLAVLLSWGWIALTQWGAFTHRASWVRGSSLTLHVLMFAAATGVLQGILGDMPLLGWSLLVLAILGFIGAVLARPEMPVAGETDERFGIQHPQPESDPEK